MGVAKLPARRAGDPSDAGPIGSWPRRHSITVSTIRFDQQRNTYVYGAEAGADLAMLTHDFLRGAPPRAVSFTRLEIRVPIGKSPDVRADGNVLLSEMPAGQRRVHRARLQTYAGAATPRLFEELADLPDRLAQPSARAAASDDEAIRALHEMPVNIFETRRYLVAGFVTNRAGSFASYEDAADDDTKPRETKLRVADATFSIGAIAEPDVIRNAIMLDENLLRVFHLAGEGRLKVKGSATSPEVEVSAEVGSRAAGHLDIAIRQAMAGAGQRAEAHVGKPVATYARWLFERHLYTAQVRFSDRLLPMADIERDHFDNLPDREPE
jgi:hypothetical protein